MKEEGIITMRIFSIGFAVFLSKFGVEGLIQTRGLAPGEPETLFDAENYVLTIEG